MVPSYQILPLGLIHLLLLWHPSIQAIQGDLVRLVHLQVLGYPGFLSYLDGQHFLLFQVSQAFQEVLETLAFLGVQEDLSHPSFQLLQFLQEDLEIQDLQDFQLHQVGRVDQLTLGVLFRLVCRVVLHFQGDQDFLCCLLIQQDQEYLSYQGDPPNLADLCVQGLLLVLVFQEVHQDQLVLVLLLNLGGQGFPLLLFHLGNLLDLLCPVLPSYQVVPVILQHHLYQIHQVCQGHQAFLEIL